MRTPSGDERTRQKEKKSTATARGFITGGEKGLPDSPAGWHGSDGTNAKMYNQLFTKILDSSIWLEPTTTRLVWVTLLAAMDEDGFCEFASAGNLAHRARVDVTECNAALLCLESPDENSSDPENDGRRIERVPGGWMVLNARKYKGLTTRDKSKEQTRLRVKRFRERKAGNADVTLCNDLVAPSESGVRRQDQMHLKNRTGRTERPNGFEDSFSDEERNSRQASGPDLDLSSVDWSQVEVMAAKLAKLVPLRTDTAQHWNNDRRQWLKYLVLVGPSFPEDWLWDAAEAAKNSAKPKKSRRAIFVSRLVASSDMTPHDFHGLVRRVNIPDEVWKSQILGGPK